MANHVLRTIADDVRAVKHEVLSITPPEYFSLKDVARSFFGALFLASTFIFSSALEKQAAAIGGAHLLAIVLTTLVVLTVEIYFIGYGRIKDRRHRPFYEFWGKRVTTFYVVALVVAFGLSYLYGFNLTLGPAVLLKFCVILSFPASVGAALADLLKKY
jgi:uncharacterized membrane protein